MRELDVSSVASKYKAHLMQEEWRGGGLAANGLPMAIGNLVVGQGDLEAAFGRWVFGGSVARPTVGWQGKPTVGWQGSAREAQGLQLYVV